MDAGSGALMALVFMPGAGSEVTQGAEQVTVDATVFYPGGTVISFADRIEYPVGSGVTYQVIGQPDALNSPLLVNSQNPEYNPVQVKLQLIAGAPGSK